MMAWSDRHARYFWRLLTHNSLLYTEMVTTGALLHGDIRRHLQFDSSEHPIALQLGGSDPADLARAAAIGEEWGYDEINLNCGCPSERVQTGSFGACLMKEPELVARGVSAMNKTVSIPVTVKCRIGVDDSDDQSFLDEFVKRSADIGCDTFIIHARKAWLKGLSPKENREIPPLMYERVFQLKQQYPNLKIILNGGVVSLPQSTQLLQHVDGVMVGREAYHNPFVLADVDKYLFDSEQKVLTREQILSQFKNYIAERLSEGEALHSMTRHILGLYRGQAGGRAFRRMLSEGARIEGADENIIDQAIAAVHETAALAA